MSRARLPTTLLVAAAAATALGCGGAPLARHRVHGRTVTRQVREVPVRGFTTRVLFRMGSRNRDIEGELLAVDPTHVWLQKGATRFALDRRLVRRMTISAFGSHAPGLAVWTTLGALSSISHGFFAVFSFPTWLGVGIPVAANSSMRTRVKVPLSWISRACQFARFPMGLPDGWAHGTHHGRRPRDWPQTGCGARVANKRAPPPARKAPPIPASQPTSQPAPRPSKPAPRPSEPAPPIDDDPKLSTP